MVQVGQKDLYTPTAPTLARWAFKALILQDISFPATFRPWKPPSQDPKSPLRLRGERSSHGIEDCSKNRGAQIVFADFCNSGVRCAPASILRPEKVKCSRFGKPVWNRRGWGLVTLVRATSTPTQVRKEPLLFPFIIFGAFLVAWILTAPNRISTVDLMLPKP